MINRPTVLVIEPTPEDRERLVGQLQSIDARIETASEPDEKLALGVAVVILSLDLDADLVAQCERLRSLAGDSDLQIVGLSTASEPSLLARALDSGIAEVVPQPADPMLLCARIRAALRLKQRLDSLKAAVPADESSERTRDLEDHARPKTVGPYRIIEPLGLGGMGTVFRAHDGRLHCSVAVKQVNNPQTRVGKERERLLREARAVAQLHHPVIVPIFDVVEDETGDWIVMEFVKGASLTEILEQRHRLTLEEGLTIAADVASALVEAHRKGILHRDLKPSNVLIDATGTTRLLDFGLARFVDADSGTQLTEEGRILGTPSCMSPEQARGQELDERSDLFSLGTVLYTVLAGRNPFAAADVVQTLRNVCLTTQSPLSDLDEVPAEVSVYVDKMLSKNPDDRPESAEKTTRVLTALRDGRPPESESPEKRRRGLLQRWRRFGSSGDE